MHLLPFTAELTRVAQMVQNKDPNRQEAIYRLLDRFDATEGLPTDERMRVLQSETRTTNEN